MTAFAEASSPGKRVFLRNVKQAQVVDDIGFALTRHGQMVVGIDWDSVIHLQNFRALEPIVEGRHQESSRLCTDAFRRLLWLDNENSIQVSWVNLLVKIGLFRPDELIEDLHSR